MIKNLFIALVSVFLLASCSSLKSLHFGSNKPVATGAVEVASTPPPNKFIENISVKAAVKSEPKPSEEVLTTPIESTEIKEIPETVEYFGHSSDVVATSSLQIKYAHLMNTDAAMLSNKILLENIDDWYGTRYRMGGTTKKGVDCSAFVGAIFAAVYGVKLPRVAREQYRYCKKISRTELLEGDLLFFNTRGGVSHVGIYLQNNKFVHASTSRGVVISDMFESYYVKRFVGAGRIENKQAIVATN